MPYGLESVPTGYSVICPFVVMRPMLFPLDSVNHSAPSGPVTISTGYECGVGIRCSVVFDDDRRRSPEYACVAAAALKRARWAVAAPKAATRLDSAMRRLTLRRDGLIMRASMTAETESRAALCATVSTVSYRKTIAEDAPQRTTGQPPRSAQETRQPRSRRRTERRPRAGVDL
jgi:hypothetical protein